MLDDSVMLDQTAFLDQYEENQNRGLATKKRVVPQNNQDKWLYYLLQNLNKANDLAWVNELLESIEANQEEFNAGKYRGAVFQMNFIAKEQMKTKASVFAAGKKSTTNLDSSLESILQRGGTRQRVSTFRSLNSAYNNRESTNIGRTFASKSIVNALAFNQKLSESVNYELSKQIDDEESETEMGHADGEPNSTTSQNMNTVSIPDFQSML